MSSDHFKTHLSSLIPASDQYRQLTTAAARYQNFVEHGGWSKIPETPELRMGSSHQNIPIIRNRLAVEDDTLNSPDPELNNYMEYLHT